MVLVANGPRKDSTPPKDANTVHYTPQYTQTITGAVPAVELGKIREYEQPCAQGRDNRKSDLCAQWKAADAALAAAEWAKWQFFLGILGAVGLLLSIYYTRRAVLAAVASNQNAQEALAHAKEMAGVELRPYLHVDEIEFEVREAVSGRSDVVIRVKNFGSTPATKFRIEAGIERRNTGKINPGTNIRTRRYASVDEIPPGHTASIHVSGFPVGSFLTKGLAYFCTVKFYYSDKFGSNHMRWETYRADEMKRGSNVFRFFLHNNG